MRTVTVAGSRMRALVGAAVTQALPTHATAARINCRPRSEEPVTRTVISDSPKHTRTVTGASSRPQALVAAAVTKSFGNAGDCYADNSSQHSEEQSREGSQRLREA